MADPTGEESQGTPPSNGSPKISSVAPRIPYSIPLAILGLLLCAALEYVHVTTHLSPGEDSFCSIGQAFDCAAVAASSQAVVLGVPWALWGFCGFVSLLIAAVLRSRWLLPLAAVAAATSVLLLGVSVLVIGSICYLCEAVHLTTFALLFFVWRGRELLIGDYRDAAALTNILGPAASFGVALILFLPPYWGSFSYKAEPPFSTGVTAEGHPWIGAENPKIEIHEFIDYACPHCKIATSRTLRELAGHPERRVVRRHQPRMKCVGLGELACREMRVAHCAGAQGKFWRADRWLFAHYSPRKKTDLGQIAKDLQLDQQGLQTCVEDKATYKWADDEADRARQAHIRETPGYLVDGKRYKPDELTKLLKK